MMTRLVGITVICLLFLCHPDKSDGLKIVRMNVFGFFFMNATDKIYVLCGQFKNRTQI